MSASIVRLVPDERARRYAALKRHLENSAVTPNAAPGHLGSGAGPRAMAGASSAPVASMRTSLELALVEDTQLAPFSGYVVTVVTYDAARRWAIAHGLCRFRGALNLRAVNARRRALGLYPFVLKVDG